MKKKNNNEDKLGFSTVLLMILMIVGFVVISPLGLFVAIYLLSKYYPDWIWYVISYPFLNLEKTLVFIFWAFIFFCIIWILGNIFFND